MKTNELSWLKLNKVSLLSSVLGGRSVCRAAVCWWAWLRPVARGDPGRHQRRVHAGVQRHLSPRRCRAAGGDALQRRHRADDHQRRPGGHLPLDEGTTALNLILEPRDKTSSVFMSKLLNCLHFLKYLYDWFTLRCFRTSVSVNWRSVLPSETACCHTNWRSTR